MNKHKQSRVDFLIRGIKSLTREIDVNDKKINKVNEEKREYRYSKRYDRIIPVPLTSKELSKRVTKKLVFKNRINFNRNRIADYKNWLNKELEA